MKNLIFFIFLLLFSNCGKANNEKTTTYTKQPNVSTKDTVQKLEKSFVIHDKELFKELVKTNLLFYAPELEDIPKNDFVKLDFKENRIKILVDTLSENERMLRENKLNELVFAGVHVHSQKFFLENPDSLPLIQAG